MSTLTRERPPATDGLLAPAERLRALCDERSFHAIRTGVAGRHPGADASRRPGDGVVAGAGEVGGRTVYCYAQDPSFMGGSLGSAHAETIVSVMRLAGDVGAPIVGFVESGGARLQEGHDALAGYGRIFRESVRLSRAVPQISVVTGVSAGGGAYSPALSDFVVMTERARMFLTGPQIVNAALGEEVSMDGLGGPGVHERNGVCHMVAADDPAAAVLARELIGYLPSRLGTPSSPIKAAGSRGPAPDASVPAEARRVYDVRDVAGAVVDGGTMLEVWPRWARNMVTAFARIDGRSVAVIANQPRRLGGVIDAAAAEKGALFVQACARFGLPLVALVDTPGFMPGTKQEGAGVIRHGASLLSAFAGARVPKVTVVLRKAYGGAAITMNSRDLGADMVFAWSQAEVGIMAARQAVGITARRKLAEAGDPDALLGELSDAYAGEHLTADAAAASGFVDEVIDPADTRERLAWALRVLEGA